MALVSKNIPNLINGISQQPASLRLSSQAEVQENGLSDVVDGLKKRPPSKFVKQFVKKTTTKDTAVLDTNNTSPLDVSNCYIHSYKRSESEQYTVVIEPDATEPTIYVYDINGNLNYQSNQASWDWTSGSCVFVQNNSDDTSYLKDVTKDDFTSTSVSDATFVVNKKKVVQDDGVVAPIETGYKACLLYTSPSPRDLSTSRMPSSA